MREADLLGAWILRSFHFEEVATGRQWEPFGPHPAGTILLHPGGRFFALITPTGRPSPVTEAEQAAAFRDLVAYSGTYRIEPPDRLVTRVDISWFPRWIGTEQLRHCTPTATISNWSAPRSTCPGAMARRSRCSPAWHGAAKWHHRTAPRRSRPSRHRRLPPPAAPARRSTARAHAPRSRSAPPRRTARRR